MEKNKSTYNEDIKEELINKYKNLVEQCFGVMEREIDEELSDDKLHAVLKAKRMASEDAKFYAKEIEAMENEINGVEIEEETTTQTSIKKYTKK